MAEPAFIKADHPCLKQMAADYIASGRLVYIEHRCPNCLGRGWFGRKVAPWAHRHCGDCGGTGWISRRYSQSDAAVGSQERGKADNAPLSVSHMNESRGISERKT